MNARPAAAPEFRLRSLTLSVYIPTILFSAGQGAVIPVVPLFARELGASIALAALIVAMRPIGLMLFDLPVGVVVSRFGDRGAMIAGTAMVAVVAIGASLSPSPIVLAVLSLLMGAGWSLWQLARLSYVSEVAPIHQRGRALSMTGGMNRVGTVAGPVIGGLLGQQFGLESAFYAQTVFGVLASAMMFVSVPATSGALDLHGGNVVGRLGATIADNRGVFISAGVPVVALQTLRQARQVFLPLWGDEIGLGVAEIGLAIGISSFVDATMFYPVGIVMDRWGRKWAGVPSLLVLAVGLLLMPLTTEFYGFTTVAAVMAFGNGLGSGLVMTLGADFAPPTRRAEFLGAWRLLGDGGAAAGPLIIGVLAGLGSLGLAAVAASGIGFVGAAMLFAFVRETLVIVPSVQAELPDEDG